jgi:hypothetical protein
VYCQIGYEIFIYYLHQVPASKDQLDFPNTFRLLPHILSDLFAKEISKKTVRLRDFLPQRMRNLG